MSAYEHRQLAAPAPQGALTKINFVYASSKDHRLPRFGALIALLQMAGFEDDASIFNDISRIMPDHATFSFARVAEFEDEACSIACQWGDRLAGKSFHVRLHRRTGETSVKLRSHTEEVLLDNAILDHLSKTGRPGRVKFEDPDYVLDIETVGPRAGMSIWSRHDLMRFPFLHVD